MNFARERKGKEMAMDNGQNSTQQTHAVTGAFGYSGKYIARRLLERGHRVKTLTNSTRRANPFGSAVQAEPFHFDQPKKLVESLRGVSVLYNTYWVRFNHKSFTHQMAVDNSVILFNAAREAGVERIVHVSITNPFGKSAPPDGPGKKLFAGLHHPKAVSDLEYFHGKARLETALEVCGVSHAILRPTVLFGKEDILINNIAWMLRRFPVFGVFGTGGYRLQPIYVDDLAQLAVEQGELRENVVINAIGPETFTYKELVQSIGRIIGKPRPIISVPPVVGYAIGTVVGKLVGDVLITRAEIDGLMAGLLHVDTPPTGTTRLTDWAHKHADSLGRSYANELTRRYNRRLAYTTT